MSEEAVVEAIADSSQAEFSESENIDVDSVSNDLAADLFPTNERETQTEEEQEPSLLQAEQKTEAQPEPEPEPVSPPPKTWPKEMHDHWAKTPKEVQDYWNTREKQMLDGLEQYRGDATFAKQIKETLNPYMATINALGIDAPTAIKSLLNADYQLRVGSPSQKAQYLQHLAKQYGVDLGQGQQEDQAQPDPMIQKLRDELHGLKQIIQTGNQQQLDEQRQKIQNEVNSFASDPKHPYFDEVSNEIVALLKSGSTLEDAYEKAVWANPVTRQKEMTRLQTEQQAELKARAIAEAEAKKKAASVNLRNRDSQRTPTGPRATMSGLDSALRETMREIKSRQ